MTHRETDLEHITTLLGQCLGRIDEQAFRLQRNEDDDDFEACDALEREAALLQELISSAVQKAVQNGDADLNKIVEHTVRGCVAELDHPIVVRSNLATDLPRIACTPGQLSFAVQRALMLVLGSTQPGDDIVVATRLESDGVWFEIESSSGSDDAHYTERAATLTEFVEAFDGSCRLGSDGRGSCLIAIQLPAAGIVRN